MTLTAWQSETNLTVKGVARRRVFKEFLDTFELTSMLYTSSFSGAKMTCGTLNKLLTQKGKDKVSQKDLDARVRVQVSLERNNFSNYFTKRQKTD